LRLGFDDKLRIKLYRGGRPKITSLFYGCVEGGPGRGVKNGLKQKLRKKVTVLPKASHSRCSTVTTFPI